MDIWEISAPRELTLRRVEDPEPAPDEVMVDVDYTTVSPGTELHAYRSGPTSMMTAPGYLAAGTVRAIGDDVDAGLLGRRVVLSSPHGSMACVGASTVTTIPDAVRSDEATMTHLAGLGHSALHSGDYRAGDDVAIVGAGLVGMATALVAEFVGARVHVLDIDQDRLDLPRSLGFEVYDARGDDLASSIQSASVAGPAVVVDTSGAWSGLHTAVTVARRNSRVCVLGVNREVPRPDVGEALFAELFTFPARFHYEGLKLIGCAGHPRDGEALEDAWTLDRCRRLLLEAMANKRLDLSPLITQHIDSTDYAQAMEAFDREHPRPFGVVLDWSRTDA